MTVVIFASPVSLALAIKIGDCITLFANIFPCRFTNKLSAARGWVPMALIVTTPFAIAKGVNAHCAEAVPADDIPVG